MLTSIGVSQCLCQFECHIAYVSMCVSRSVMMLTSVGVSQCLCQLECHYVYINENVSRGVNMSFCRSVTMCTSICESGVSQCLHQ